MNITKIFTIILLITFGGSAMADEHKAKLETAIFAGGCFWCTEAGFDLVEGVVATTSGYTGGHTKDPTYEEVSGGKTGHYEAIEVLYDPTQVSYEFLLDVFWQNIDPTDRYGQFVDRGPQYKTAIFFKNDEEERLAIQSKKRKQAGFKEPIVTEILPVTKFYAAELYHQDYYKNNPLQYNLYKRGSGRDEKLEKIWGDKE